MSYSDDVDTPKASIAALRKHETRGFMLKAVIPCNKGILT